MSDSTSEIVVNCAAQEVQVRLLATAGWFNASIGDLFLGAVEKTSFVRMSWKLWSTERKALRLRLLKERCDGMR